MSQDWAIVQGSIIQRCQSKGSSRDPNMQAQKCELARGHVILLADILKLFVCVCVCVCVCVEGVPDRCISHYWHCRLDYVIALLVSKMFTVQTLFCSMKFMPLINLGHGTIRI